MGVASGEIAMDETARELALSEFIARLSEEMYWDASILHGDSTLLHDCNLDSMGMYELLLLLEDMGAVIDEDALFSWITLADVYRTFMQGGEAN